MTARTNTNNESTAIQVSNGIEISVNDKRTYDSLVLENGLQVLVISDPSTEKSSASMDVHVGHLSDPDHLPGLAHFCEHMLFLGTEKYPNENSYNQYLSEHGGHSNAFTSSTDTNYYFDVVTSGLYEALDRFAQFFISPLFTPSATDRELNAVHSENAKNLQNDYWRFNQLYKNFARPDHPFHKFGTGNLQTLKEIPESRGVDIRKALLEFHETFYSANIMKLVIYGKEDISLLKSWTQELFSDITNTQREIPQFPGEPYGPAQLCKWTEIVPIKDMNLIEVVWPLPPLRSKYLEQPHRYLAHLLGHEGTGSLLSELKARGWANELSSGLTKDEEDWSLFSVTVEATPKGVADVYDVITTIYQYLSMLRDQQAQAWIFYEKQALELMHFRFRNKERPMSYTSSLSRSMHEHPIEHVITGKYIGRSFNAQDINDFVSNQFIPSRMRVFLVSKAFEGSTQSVEKWYQTPYTETDIPPEKLNQWTNHLLSYDAQIFHLPIPNDFLATNFDLVESTSKTKSPQCLLDTPECRMWYKPDDVFEQPIVNIFLSLMTPKAYACPIQAVLTDMYVRCIKDQLTEIVYNAELAGMKYVFCMSQKGLELYLSGYSEKLHVLLQVVLAKMCSVSAQVSQEHFQRIKDKIKRNYLNFNQEQPYQHAVYESNYLLENTRWHNVEKLHVIDGIQFSDLQHHAQTLFGQMYLEALLHGNVTETGAMDLIQNQILKHFRQSSVLFESQKGSLNRVVQIPDQRSFCYQQQTRNDQDQNSAIQILFQFGLECTEQSAILTMLEHLIKEPCFHQLRTTEQLGYLIFSGVHRIENVEFFRFIIQSDKYGPEHLDARIEDFILRFSTHLTELSRESFDKFITAIQAQLLEKPKTLWEESMRYWKEINRQSYQFNFRQELSDVVATLTPEKMLEAFRERLHAESSARRKLSVQFFGSSQTLPSPVDDEALSNVASKQIENGQQFKRQMSLFPMRQSRSVSVVGSTAQPSKL